MYPAPRYAHQVIYGECLAGTVVWRRCSSEKYFILLCVWELSPIHVRFLWRTDFLQSWVSFQVKLALVMRMCCGEGYINVRTGSETCWLQQLWVSTHRCHRYPCVGWGEQGAVCGENRFYLQVPLGSVLQMGTQATEPLPGMECHCMAGSLTLCICYGCLQNLWRDLKPYLQFR